MLKKTADQSSDLYDKTCNSYQSLKDPNTGRARDDCASTPEEIPAARSVFSLSDGGGESLSFDRKRSVFCTFSDFPCKIDPSTSQLALRRGVPGGSVFRTHEETCKVPRTRRKRPCPGASPLKRQSVPVSEKIGARRNKCKQGGCDEQ